MATSNRHSIKASLCSNPFTNDPDNYLARVNPEKSLSTREICHASVTRGGASSTADVMEYNVNMFLKEMAYQLSDGFSVNTGYFTAGVLIKGVFNSPDETFDPDKHSVLFHFNQGALLRNEISNINVEITGIARTGCMITEVVDIKSGSVNDVITPNRNLLIKGQKLKIVGDHADVGICFINKSTGDVIKVSSSDIVYNKPSELIIIMPDLAPGAYRLQVTTQFSGTTSYVLKKPGTFLFEELLSVH